MIQKKEVATDKAPAAVGAYSQGIEASNLVFTSGQIPFDEQGELVSEKIGEQTRRCLLNVKEVLQEAGADLEQVIKCTLFISNMDEFSEVNEVYSEFFNPPYPARSCVEVAELPKGVKVEIEAIAVKE